MPKNWGTRVTSLQGMLQLGLQREGLTAVVRHGAIVVTTPKDAESWIDRTNVWSIAKDEWSQFQAVLQEESPMEFIETPLVDIADFLSDLHRVPIVLDQPSLRQAGVAADVPVSLNISGTSLARMLDDLQLRLVADGGRLLITAREPTVIASANAE